MDVVKISEAALKRIVCMARDLAAFQALDIEDKKNIVKGARPLRWFHCVLGFIGAISRKLQRASHPSRCDGVRSE